jgi:hypothetical protein
MKKIITLKIFQNYENLMFYLYLKVITVLPLNNLDFRFLHKKIVSIIRVSVCIFFSFARCIIEEMSI